MMTSHALSVQNTLKFLLAPLTLANLVYVKRRKIGKIVVCPFWRAQKLAVFVSRSFAALPSEKIPAGAYENIVYVYCFPT